MLLFDDKETSGKNSEKAIRIFIRILGKRTVVSDEIISMIIEKSNHVITGAAGSLFQE